MNKTLIAILAFTAGAGTGYLVANKVLTEKYEVLIQEELESIRQTQAKKTMSEEAAEQDAEKERIMNERQGYEQRANLYAGAEGDYEEVADKPYEPTDEDFIDTDKPYVIPANEFTDERLIYEKETLYYYDGDGTLTDSGEEIIANPEEIIGDDPLTYFGEPDQSNTAYVRNEKLASDYEIICVPGKYSELVLGMVDDEPHTKKHHGED